MGGVNGAFATQTWNNQIVLARNAYFRRSNGLRVVAAPAGAEKGPGSSRLSLSALERKSKVRKFRALRGVAAASRLKNMYR